MTEREISEQIERAQREAVRLLDEWASKGYRAWYTERQYGNRWRAGLLDNNAEGRYFYGDSPEAARANAAEAIRGELP